MHSSPIASYIWMTEQTILVFHRPDFVSGQDRHSRQWGTQFRLTSRRCLAVDCCELAANRCQTNPRGS
jgi:hypothetical protein